MPFLARSGVKPPIGRVEVAKRMKTHQSIPTFKHDEEETHQTLSRQLL